MLKKEIRELYRNKRLALSEQEMVKADDLLLIQFQTVELPFLHSVLSYWPIEENNEPNTHLVTEFIRFRNPEVRIAYPVADFESMTMTAVAVDIDTAFTKKEMNISEPMEGEPLTASDLDLILVPLLAFDKKGYRIGYGKGFYDRYLKTCRPDCIKIGLSYFEPVEHIEDGDQFDVPLNVCITPAATYVF